MQKTTAPNSSGGAFVDEVSSVTLGTTWQAVDANAHQNEICNAITYNGGANGWVGQVLSGADSTQLFETLMKAGIEKSHFLGELFYKLDYQVPVVFNPANPHTYFPALCIDSPSGSPGPAQTITTTHWPLLVPYLIAFRSTIYDGQGGSTAQFSVTTGIVNSNIVCLTLTTNTANLAMLTALYEDAIVNNNAATGFTAGTPSWTNWQTITLPSSITIGADTINAGTYALVADAANNGGNAVTPSTYKVSFSYTASNVGSTACAGNVEFHPFAVAGSSTSAQIMAMQGRALISPNDIDPITGFPRYVPGQRTRDRFLSHQHYIQGGSGIYGSTGNSAGEATLATLGSTFTGNVLNPYPDGVNATSLTGRMGPTTDVRALAAHLYIHGGQTI
jgi:hypothetical protein